MGHLPDSRSYCGVVGWPDCCGNESWKIIETTMSKIRIQASVNSGNAILRVRNGLDKPVTLALFLYLLEVAEPHWSPLLAPVDLRPGEMYSADVSNPIRDRLPSTERTDSCEVRMRIRVLLLPAQPVSPREVDCKVIFYRNQFSQFACH